MWTRFYRSLCRGATYPMIALWTFQAALSAALGVSKLGRHDVYGWVLMGVAALHFTLAAPTFVYRLHHQPESTRLDDWLERRTGH